MNIQGVELVINFITIVMAYLIAITLTGSFRAWVAHSFGDDTAESLGLLTLNPLAHVDFLGAFFLIFFRFGWGRYVPINPHKIHGRFRWLKIAFAYLSDTLAHIVMGITVFLALISAFGQRVLYLVLPMVCRGEISQSAFAAAYPGSSSIAISLALIGSALIFFNVLLAVLDFIISGFSLFAMMVLEHSPTYNKYRNVLMVAIPMLLIYFFINKLCYLVVRILLWGAGLFGSL